MGSKEERKEAGEGEENNNNKKKIKEKKKGDRGGVFQTEEIIEEAKERIGRKRNKGRQKAKYFNFFVFYLSFFFKMQNYLLYAFLVEIVQSALRTEINVFFSKLQLT